LRPTKKRVASDGPSHPVFNANYLTCLDLTMTELWRELGGYQAGDSTAPIPGRSAPGTRYLQTDA